ncbi:uncharacterized protein LOC119288780 isoform X2 [Triticum dicoccoides]|uniref:Uncharacterized protein n=1 Tax=Triticum turgidum subsp. durum TaxID=4567 RepID=A0A9R0VWN4_TRITD|nr:uncharacterized protein LOC119288780 isoform X2 [Triticum dicoccoides]VAH89961.1 unnamed protein product [Triticum turgidum subsp. durum]
MDADWTWACRAWEKWTAKHVGSSVAGMPVKAALLLNYDPTGPSRLLPIVAEEEGTKFTAVDLQPFINFFRRNNLQTEFFSIGPNQCMMVLLVRLHRQWWLLISLHGTSTGEHINFLWCRLMALQCSV